MTQATTTLTRAGTDLVTALRLELDAGEAEATALAIESIPGLL